jgi:predicted permease
MPGVTAAGASSALPLSGNTDQGGLLPEGWTGKDDQSTLTVDLVRATPAYFEAMGIPLLRGRGFTWDDRADTPLVAVVDELLARRVWPDSDPVGRAVTIGDRPARIVGVVRQARLYRMQADDRPQVFVPWTQDTTLGLTLAIRTTGDPAALAGPLRQAVWALDPNQPVADLMPMMAHVDLSLAERRLQLALLGAFAACAILLASLGLYGVVASTVSERQQEMGIRAALGASGRQIRTMVLRQALWLTGAGIAAGVAGALALGGLVTRFAFGVTGRDPLTLGATVGILLAVALAAAYVPARRASRVDPLVALRE